MLVGQADLYANFHVPGEKTKKNREGRMWDIVGSAAFYVEFVKDPARSQGLEDEGSEDICRWGSGGCGNDQEGHDGSNGRGPGEAGMN